MVDNIDLIVTFLVSVGTIMLTLNKLELVAISIYVIMTPYIAAIILVIISGIIEEIRIRKTKNKYKYTDYIKK